MPGGQGSAGAPRVTPTRYDNLGVWNAYVAAGKTREERAARLATVPERYRRDVERHVMGYFRLRALKTQVQGAGEAQ